MSGAKAPEFDTYEIEKKDQNMGAGTARVVPAFLYPEK